MCYSFLQIYLCTDNYTCHINPWSSPIVWDLLCFLVWGLLSNSLWTDCRWFRSPVCRWGNWLLIGEWKQLLEVPLSTNHSVRTLFCEGLKEVGRRPPGGPHPQSEPVLDSLRTSAPETASQRLCSVFLAAPRGSSVCVCVCSGTPWNLKPLYTISLTFYLTGACRSTFHSDYTLKMHLIIGLLSK